MRLQEELLIRVINGAKGVFTTSLYRPMSCFKLSLTDYNLISTLTLTDYPPMKYQQANIVRMTRN